MERNESNGGNIDFGNYSDLEKYFAEEKLHPADLKSAVEKYINRLLEPIRKTFEDPELKKLVAKAYPQPNKNSKSTLILQNANSTTDLPI